MRKGRPQLFLLLLSAALLLGACGLLVGEPFIEPLFEANITREFNDRALVDFRAYPAQALDPLDPFSHFAIFYRIYISDTPVPATTTDTFNAINPTLHANFNTVSPFIDSDTLIGTNMHNLFSGMNFRYLSLGTMTVTDGVATITPQDINAVLNRAIGTYVVEFNFSQSQQIPVIRLGGSEYVLLRATGHQGIGFTPRPEHRLFLNSLDLRNPDFINVNENADVVDRAGIDPMRRDFTFVAMFLVAVGMNSATFATVYSTPSLIHVFQLPDD